MLRDYNPDSKQEPSLARAAELLSVSRSGLYYKPAAPSDSEIATKNLIDLLHTDHPAWGSRQLSRQLKAAGMNIGRLKVRRLMAEMGIEAIYPKPKLSKAAGNHPVYPYLLKNFVPTRPNQAWSIDITYIRMKRGFMYLTAIIDWYSRMIVGFELDDTLSTQMVKTAVSRAFETAKPEILNSDQGSQFTSRDYISFVESNRVRISMDGKGRWADNIPIERWFRTLKYEEIYLKEYESPKEARREIGRFINDYNFKRIHSAINSTPAYTYYPVQLYSMLTASPSAILDRPA